MLLVDDILFSPVKGINWIFKKIHELAEEELAGEADRLRENLTELYMQLETGEITEEAYRQQSESCRLWVGDGMASCELQGNEYEHRNAIPSHSEKRRAMSESPHISNESR